jgi:6-phosphogluconolactonase
MTSMPMCIHASLDETIADLAELVTHTLENTLLQHRECSLVLAGGSTPRALYQRLAQADLAGRVAWERVHVYWGDERCVPQNDASSNYSMACEALLSKVPIKAEHIHPMRAEREPATAAAEYGDLLLGKRLDIVLLGMGADGHIASLFPNGKELEVESAATQSLSPIEPTNRISLSLPTINGAQHVFFLVCGTGKSHRIQEVRAQLQLPIIPSTLPAARVRPNSGPALWFGDRDALST